eukprot:gb/GEZN01013537.1/.p1 GENE.gb/GEZN01013537.1/~~gb/GEZN01013537.1/.p1  ORF type:complete len:182 (-),score=33.47 gb/GEZN01013537.1/:243-788(-)
MMAEATNNAKKGPSREVKVVMVVVDGSPESDHAFEQALSWKHEEDRLYVVHAVETPVPSTTSLLIHSADPTDLIKETEAYEEKGKEVSRKYDQTITKRKLRHVEVDVLVGHDAKESVLKFAQEKKVDIIFTGCRGMGVMQRMFMGSFSAYLVEHATCDVVVVKHPQDKGKGGKETEITDKN